MMKAEQRFKMQAFNGEGSLKKEAGALKKTVKISKSIKLSQRKTEKAQTTNTEKGINCNII